ncbi:uncharacterized protein LOC106658523 [Trichogramma pretiosum]|uniref:uncharacterized protein LOC106658523 n=1 Tax=Trichogramma pretiosum TaxID=7493 RepID=UPI000C71A844|nr:uncharacterized protein LOC106658523 [Trichogramma pretiosum]
MFDAQFSITLILFTLVQCNWALSCSERAAETRYGKVQGSTETSITGDEYCAFKGLPYAKPPIGDLRFKDPIPPDPWDEVKILQSYGDMCPQVLPSFPKPMGNEDCLYLNVFTKSLDSKNPVMVWVHGGAFNYGSGDDFLYGPDYFMRRDAVLVTINYRLGILGFLNLEDKLAPGNQGLKDQVMALKWVRDNIASFGGDPDRVTIFGESAGAASVHYLTLSPMTKGLFRQAIIQSGTALNPWTQKSPNPREYASKVCALLGKNAESPEEILQVLGSADAIELSSLQHKVSEKTEMNKIILPWVPSTDDESNEPFMPIDVEMAAKEGIHVPLIIGYNNREGVITLMRISDKDLPKIDENIENGLHPYTIKLMNEMYHLPINELRRIYFKDDERIDKDTKDKLTDMMGDLSFVEGTHRVARIQLQKSNTTTYLYRYEFDKNFSVVKKIAKTKISGASHADDLSSLFRYTGLERLFKLKPLEKGTDNYSLMENMVDMWVNFATYGTPTPKDAAVDWPRLTNSEQMELIVFNSTIRVDSTPNIEQLFRRSSSRRRKRQSDAAANSDSSAKSQEKPATTEQAAKETAARATPDILDSELCARVSSTPLSRRVRVIAYECAYTEKMPFSSGVLILSGALLICHGIGLTRACDTTVVETRSGKLEGSAQTSILGDEFCAFKGIPYAKPPLDDLRFRDPLPPDPWQDVRSATKFGNECCQFNFIFHRAEGNEDCLYLNVYTKTASPDIPRPVMVWIHGGAFEYGSGDDLFYGPDYFMRRNIVLVTLNYRLGAFGFLNLEDKLAPGNQGLKDQVMALQWVRDNIVNFGGDPNHVTIFGESAGAASVHYLTLSPMAKGLFTKAIIQSGVVLNPWARALPHPREIVYRFCSVLGKNTTDHEEIMSHLRTTDSHEMMKQQDALLTENEKLKAFLTFGPSVDNESDEPFMPIDPLIAAEEGIQYPLIIGSTSREGILMLIRTGKDFKRFNSNFEQWVHPYTIDLFKKTYNLTAEEVKFKYYGNEEISADNREKLIDLVGDIYFMEGIHRVVKTQVQKSVLPTYLYKFSYDKGFSPIKKLTRTHMSGASHGDELPELFRMRLTELIGMKPLQNGTAAYRVMLEMIEMWTNFAISGMPTPAVTDYTPVYWHPVTDADNLHYLNIDAELSIETTPSMELQYSALKNAETKLNLSSVLNPIYGVNF